jgi:hypothetical protein
LGSRTPLGPQKLHLLQQLLLRLRGQLWQQLYDLPQPGWCLC